MFGEQIVGSLERFLRIVVRVAWLNCLWIAFTLMGLVFAGVFPATTAAISVSRKWVQNKEDVSVFQTFKKSYKKEFLKSNIIGIVLTFIAAILFLNYHALLQFGDQMPVVVVFAYYFIILLYSILVIWIFPLLTHYQSSIKNHFKNAFIIGITNLPITLLISLFIFIIIYISLEIPSMFIFCTMSLLAIIVSFLSMRVFEKIDHSNIDMLEQNPTVETNH
ncbi:YesL family protein [Aquibacillus koreensis]|uniref:YesL family protein n=1 Tax=Aquibacillus koreensis TaxID=279446 RepID=A0A9X4AL91_9BACI|nr:YesL family protein [Aquibacillus koreensis]MCT2535393.1 YesL family protein [Aquibacillus koreensis]MDC3422228.1 YesL family protein [Aquibacillus koreensis]